MIIKGKIIQFWDKNHECVIKYSQELKDDQNNKHIKVEAETLNDLMSKVKLAISQIK